LWGYAYQNIGSGDLTHLDAEGIAEAAGWRGDSETWRNALCVTGWIDVTEEKTEIHDWRGRWAIKGEISPAAKRQKAYRERLKARQDEPQPDTQKKEDTNSRRNALRNSDGVDIDRDIDITTCEKSRDKKPKKTNGKTHHVTEAKILVSDYAGKTGRKFYKPEAQYKAVAAKLRKGMPKEDIARLFDLAAADGWRQGEGRKHGTPEKLLKDKTIEHYLGGETAKVSIQAKPERVEEPELDQYCEELTAAGCAVRRDRVRELMQAGQTVNDVINQLGVQ
jgi:hypothetical protein